MLIQGFRLVMKADRVDTAEEDVLAYRIFCKVHRRRFRSLHLMDRLSRGAQMSLHVVNIFPINTSIRKLVGENGEWVANRHWHDAGNHYRSLQ